MTEKHYKLLVVDIDGTLVDKHGNISAKDHEALDKARESEVKVSLSTGRSLKACLDIIEQLSLDGYHIFFDGALVSTPSLDEEIYASPISKTIIKQMIDFVHSHSIDLELFSASHYFVECETWSTEVHREFFGVNFTMADFARLWKQERIVKGGLTITNPTEEAKMVSFRDYFGDRLHFSKARTPAYPDVTFINIVSPLVSKGKALEALAAYLKTPLREVMAVGDGTNDIPLLATAGLAIAMGNATDEVKKIASYVTLDVEQSGLAAAINRFLL